MSWSHLILEGHCLFEEQNGISIPRCCEKGPNNIGLYCLTNIENENLKCSYFGYLKARSTVALTNDKGDVVRFDSFELFDVDEKKMAG